MNPFINFIKITKITTIIIISTITIISTIPIKAITTGLTAILKPVYTVLVYFYRTTNATKVSLLTRIWLQLFQGKG
jgi:hypothetical protein